MQNTLAIQLTGDPVQAVEVLANRYALNEGERAGVLRHLIVAGDLSAYGLVNAVTHYSEDVEDYDRATEFEGLGGKLIELSSLEWEELAAAVRSLRPWGGRHARSPELDRAGLARQGCPTQVASSTGATT